MSDKKPRPNLGAVLDELATMAEKWKPSSRRDFTS